MIVNIKQLEINAHEIFTLKYLVVVAQLQLVNSDRNFAHARNLRVLIKARVQSGISWLAFKIKVKLVCMELLH